MFVTIVILIVIFLILFVVALFLKQYKELKDFKEAGFLLQYFVYTNRYIGGHPEIDKPQPSASLYPKDDKLLIFNNVSGTKEIASIPKKSIKNIVLEDQTTIEKRVGLIRMLAAGILAFAMMKTEKNELAYLVIEWNDGRFDHETAFEFSGEGALTRANEARNKLIRNI